MADVFLSYASEDGERAVAVVKALENAGYSVWWDRHLLSGQRFTQSIQRELSQAAAVVVVWTRASVESEWVYSEARRGNQRGALVQLRAEDITIDDIPAPFDAFHCPVIDDSEALLRSVAALVATPSATAPQPGTERKVVTALVAELEPSPGLDPEDYETVVAPYQARLRAAVEGYGGTPDASSGTSMTAMFGAPRSHEDDPERAVRTGLEMLVATTELNAESGHRFALRVGIGTGEALVSAGSRVTGDTVAVAHRLQAAAPADTVLASHETYLASRAAIEYEPHDTSWRAVRSRGSAGEDLADTSLPMIGREDELAQLQRSYSRAVRESSVQLVTIVAEPGMGKSRLVQAFSDWIDAREELVRWRQGKCPPYGVAVAFAAFADVVKAQTDILDSDDEETAQHKLTDSVTALVEGTELAEQASWLVARLSPLVGLPASETPQEELFTAWRRFLEAMAAKGPLVVVVEDLHWADPALLDFLTHVLEWTVGVPLMIVTTARPELFDKAPTWAAGQRNATTLSLAPLDQAETGRLVRSMLGTRTLPAAVEAALLTKSDGNPLYAREYLTILTDRPELELDESRLSELAAALPGSVQAVIAARLDTLPGDAKQLLQAAAVIGHTFWSGALAALTGVEEASLELRVHDLVRRDYLRPSRTSRVAGQAEYTFAHALIADVAYQQLPRTQRARYHLATADWYAARVVATSSEAAVVAHHYTEACTSARLSNGAPDQVGEMAANAALWHSHAAENARSADPATALRHATTAVELTGDADPKRSRRLIVLGELNRDRGQYAQAAQLLEEAHRVAESQGDAVAAGYADALRASQLPHLGRADEAEPIALAAVGVLESQPPGAELVEAYLQLAQLQNRAGRAREGIATTGIALALMDRLGDTPPGTAARAWLNSGDAKIWAGDPTGVDDLHKALTLAQEHNLTSIAIWVGSALSGYSVLAQSSEAAVGHLETTLRTASVAGVEAANLQTLAYGAETLVIAGRIDEAISVSREALALTSDRADGAIPDIYASYWAWPHLIAGHLDEARALLSEAAPRINGASMDEALHWMLVTAEWEHATGEKDPAWAEVETLLEAFDRADVHELISQFAAPVARVMAQAGRIDQIERLTSSMLTGMVFYDNHRLSALATLAQAQDDLARALELHEQAAAAWAAYGYPLEQAHSLVGAAQCLNALGRPGRPAAEPARTILVTIGAHQLLRELDAQPLGSSEQR